MLGDCYWGTLFCPNLSMLLRKSFDFPAWGEGIISPLPPLLGSLKIVVGEGPVKVEAGADDKEYLAGGLK